MALSLPLSYTLARHRFLPVQITKSKALLAEPRAGLPDALVQMIDVVRSYLPLVEINDFESSCMKRCHLARCVVLVVSGV